MNKPKTFMVSGTKPRYLLLAHGMSGSIHDYAIIAEGNKYRPLQDVANALNAALILKAKP